MKFLDQSKLTGLLDGRLAATRSQRLVGANLRWDSGYDDILRFFGTYQHEPSAITVHYLDEPFTVSDPLIAEYALEVESMMREAGRLHDGPAVMKLAGVDFENRSPSITVQPVSYGLQAATCFALDYPHQLFDKHGGTLRQYCLSRYSLEVVETNPLAICLGVCAYVIFDEQGRRYLLQVRRSGHLASLEGTPGPSVAGVVDYVEGYRNLQDILDHALDDEIREELNLKRDDYEVAPLAWAMEIFRGYRPQIFALVRASLDREDFESRLTSIAPEAREFDHYVFQRLYGDYLLDQKHFDDLNPEARMNYLLMEEFLS